MLAIGATGSVAVSCLGSTVLHLRFELLNLISHHALLHTGTGYNQLEEPLP